MLSAGELFNPAPARAGVFAVLAVFIAGCSPTVTVETPKEPITINLNVKLDAEIRLKLEEKAEEDVANNPIF